MSNDEASADYDACEWFVQELNELEARRLRVLTWQREYKEAKGDPDAKFGILLSVSNSKPCQSLLKLFRASAKLALASEEKRLKAGGC